MFYIFIFNFKKITFEKRIIIILLLNIYPKKMLNEIFNNYSEKKSLFPKLREERNIELSKEELKNKKDTFLNEEEII